MKTKTFLCGPLAVYGALASLSGPVLAQAPAAPPEPKHYVFAHYMLCFGSSVEFYKREIELAQRSGIDGFALNAGEWLGPDGKPSGYVGSADRLYQAAQELNTGFKLFFSPDLNGLQNLGVNIPDMVDHFKNHPAQMRHNGKIVLSGWAGGPASYADAVGKIRAAGNQVFFVPFPFNSRYSFNWSAATVDKFYEGQPHMDGVFFFGADGVYPEIARTNAVGTRVSHARGKLFMAGISPAFNSPNLRDFHGMQGFDTMWRGVIAADTDWVELVTWNDYNEDSNLMPFRWPAGSEKNHISRDEAFLELNSYYSAWYKTGVQPAIKQDKLYYAYRNRSKYLTKGWNPDKKEWYDITRGEGRVDQIHDDVEDNVYVTTLLTAPADLTVTIGKATKTFPMPAGIAHVAVPMEPGVPHFTLNRKASGGKPVLDFWGRKLILSKETEENSVAGYHLQNRTWAGAAAAGTGTRIEAESGTPAEGATLVKDGKVTAVQNLEKDNSGATIPVPKLKTGYYNLRITYSNPSDSEARLTLFADGAPHDKNDPEAYIPLFLPPTGKGEYRTTSFFWSLYDTTTHLKLAWVLGREWGQPRPANDDKGSVLIDAVELVPVAPVTMPAPIEKAPVVKTAAKAPAVDPAFEMGNRDKGPEVYTAATPPMVDIPGGTFRMGSPAGAPDEGPQHEVTLSAFAMGKTEITNKQYEQFDPSHKELRDEFSSRDSDPVIYVSWRDAAKYCNWLSKQANLTPVYDEASGAADPKATGYRLPTEAEWEYVASGRGENRVYPWGNEAPDATRGNFLLTPPGTPGQPADFIGYGTSAAGSYPAGASRDGVLDLAGNTSEWCADYYAPYSADAATNPLNQTPSNYRVLRGNSWGYYGRTPRAADREYNSPGYPGYIYLGFRVALSKP